MKKFRLIIITLNQNSVNKAEKLGKLIGVKLNSKNRPIITKYPKFNNSYKLEFSGLILEKDLIKNPIEITDRICCPWLVSYDRENNQIKLVFNRTEFSHFRQNEFNVIHWANFEIE